MICAREKQLVRHFRMQIQRKSENPIAYRNQPGATVTQARLGFFGSDFTAWHGSEGKLNRLTEVHVQVGQRFSNRTKGWVIVQVSDDLTAGRGTVVTVPRIQFLAIHDIVVCEQGCTRTIVGHCHAKAQPGEVVVPVGI